MASPSNRFREELANRSQLGEALDRSSTSEASMFSGATRSSASGSAASAQRKNDEAGAGYDVDLFVEPLSEKHQCPICRMVLREPQQTPCGHRFCKFCIRQAIRESSRAICPVDRQPLDQIFADNFCKREVLQLRIKCSHFSEGCTWRGELGGLQRHLEKCDMETVPCPNIGCNERVRRRSLTEHAEMSCPYRCMVCEHCYQKIPYHNLKIHLQEECPRVLKMCPYNCGATFSKQEQSKHLLDCPEMEVQCMYSTVGCKEKGKRRDINRHLDDPDSVKVHLELACRTLGEKTNELSALETRLRRQKTDISNLTARLQSAEEKGRCDQEMILSRIQQLERSVSQGTSSPQVNQALLQRVLALEANTSASEQNMLVVQRQLTDIQSGMVKLSRETAVNASNADSHDLRLLGLEAASYDGVLIWRINITQAIADAERGEKMSIYSPPFYTSRHGYKMCARLYPKGDGSGKNSHLSFFFVVMNGEFDALLHWPFHQRVTLTLLDQSRAQRHISETFLPDPASSSFQRPTTGMNIASGCPRFVSLELLRSGMHGYVNKDGIMFLKVGIDTSTISAI